MAAANGNAAAPVLRKLRRFSKGTKYYTSPLTGLQSTRTNYDDQSVGINRVYSTPLVQNIVNATNHMVGTFGDAADLATGYAQTILDDLHDAGLVAGACVEPENLSTINHVHADWHRAAGVPCPPQWSH
jgi:hypothetical protein